MLNEHKLTMQREFRHGGGETPRSSAFTQEQIELANAEHDRRMGFSFALPTIYTNPNRHPETHVGPAETLWQNEKR